MIKTILGCIIAISFISCCETKKLSTSTKKLSTSNDLPACLQQKIKTMSANAQEGMPQSITRYNYHDKTVYYMVAHCCDKYNIVFDSACNILGYPDGGYAGKGDEKMPDFFKEAKKEKVIWINKKENK